MPCRYRGAILIVAVPVRSPTLLQGPHRATVLLLAPYGAAAPLHLGAGRLRPPGGLWGLPRDIKPDVSLQVLVVACVLLVVPRGSPRASFISRLAPDTFSKRAEQMDNSIPEGQGRDVFCIVFDAGSTGSRPCWLSASTKHASACWPVIPSTLPCCSSSLLSRLYCPLPIWRGRRVLPLQAAW